MKKNWKTLIAASLACVMLLAGCGTTASTDTGSGEVITNADEPFIADLQAGLEARWKLSEEQEAEWTKNSTTPEDGSEEQIEAYRELVAAELNYISKYSNAEFVDEDLQQKADTYIRCLQVQDRALLYAESDYDQFQSDWTTALADRCMLIADFANDFGLTVDEQYQQTLDNLIVIAETLKEMQSEQTTGSAA